MNSEDHQDIAREIPEPTEPSNSIWGDFDAEMSQVTRPENSVAAGIRDLDKYLNEEYLHRKEDPLQWWHSGADVRIVTHFKYLGHIVCNDQ